MKQQLRNFGWLSTERIFRLVAGFAVTMLLARHLGADGFGSYGYVLGLVTLFTPITFTGIDLLLSKHIVEDRQASGRVLASALALRIPGALAAFALAIGTMVLLPNPDGTNVTLVGIAAILLLATPFQGFSIYFKAIERPSISAIGEIAITIAITGATFVMIANGGSVTTFIQLRSLEAVLLAAYPVILLYFWRKRLGPIHIDVLLLKALWKNSIPLMLAGIGAMIYMRIDQIMLGQMSSIAQLGQYTLAVRISDSALFIPAALQMVLFPAIVRSYRDQGPSFESELRSYFSKMFYIMFGAAIGLALAGFVIIRTFVGPSYEEAIPMIAILALALPCVGLGVARTGYLTLKEWFWTAPAATMLGALVNIALNFLLIPPYAGTGAAIATVISQFIAAVGTCFLFPRLMPIGRTMISAMRPVVLWQAMANYRLANAGAGNA